MLDVIVAGCESGTVKQKGKTSFHGFHEVFLAAQVPQGISESEHDA